MRTSEIGIRTALGATQGDILGMFVGRAVALVAAGIVLGISTTLALGHIAEGFVFGIATNDPGTFEPVISFTLLAATTAAAIPAWRALKVAPATAIQRT